MNEHVLRGAQNRGRVLGHKYVTSYLTDPDRAHPSKSMAFLFGLATWPTLDRIREVAETLVESWDPRLHDPLEEVIQVINLETGETEGFIEIKEGKVRSWFLEGSAASQPNDPRDAQGQASEPPKEEKKPMMLYVGGATRSFRCECGANVFTKRTIGRLVRYYCNGCQACYSEG